MKNRGTKYDVTDLHDNFIGLLRLNRVSGKPNVILKLVYDLSMFCPRTRV